MPNNAHPTPSSMVHFTKYYHTTSMIGSLDQSNQSILQTKASRIILSKKKASRIILVLTIKKNQLVLVEIVKIQNFIN